MFLQLLELPQVRLVLLWGHSGLGGRAAEACCRGDGTEDGSGWGRGGDRLGNGGKERERRERGERERERERERYLAKRPLSPLCHGIWCYAVTLTCEGGCGVGGLPAVEGGAEEVGGWEAVGSGGGATAEEIEGAGPGEAVRVL